MIEWNMESTPMFDKFNMAQQDLCMCNTCKKASGSLHAHNPSYRTVRSAFDLCCMVVALSWLFLRHVANSKAVWLVCSFPAVVWVNFSTRPSDSTCLDYEYFTLFSFVEVERLQRNIHRSYEFDCVSSYNMDRVYAVPGVWSSQTHLLPLGQKRGSTPSSTGSTGLWIDFLDLR